MKHVMQETGLELFLKNGKTTKKAPVMECKNFFYRKSSVDGG